MENIGKLFAGPKKTKQIAYKHDFRKKKMFAEVHKLKKKKTSAEGNFSYPPPSPGK